jgi:hypothetical protein
MVKSDAIFGGSSGFPAKTRWTTKTSSPEPLEPMTRDPLNPRGDPVLHVHFPAKSQAISNGFLRKIPKIYKSYNFVDWFDYCWIMVNDFWGFSINWLEDFVLINDGVFLAVDLPVLWSWSAVCDACVFWIWVPVMAKWFRSPCSCWTCDISCWWFTLLCMYFGWGDFGHMLVCSVWIVYYCGWCFVWFFGLEYMLLDLLVRFLSIVDGYSDLGIFVLLDFDTPVLMLADYWWILVGLDYVLFWISDL